MLRAFNHFTSSADRVPYVKRMRGLAALHASIVHKRTILAGFVLAAAACGLLITNVAQSSVSARTAGIVAGDVTVSPFAIMVKAQRDLPVEYYDAY